MYRLSPSKSKNAFCIRKGRRTHTNSQCSCIVEVEGQHTELYNLLSFGGPFGLNTKLARKFAGDCGGKFAGPALGSHVPVVGEEESK